MKRLVILVCAILMVSSLSVLALDRKKGDVNQGKMIFKEQCKVCHNGKKAKKLTPAHKTRAQWKRYLKDNAKKLNRKHNKANVKINLSEKDINDLWAFCYVGALDSEKPQTCD